MTNDAQINSEIGLSEQRRYTAMLNADTAELQQLLADDLVYTHSNAERDTKASYLRKVADKTFDYEEIDHKIDQIVVTGDSAIVVGWMRATLTLYGRRIEIDNASMAVWTRANGAWQLIGYQPTVRPSA
ncbi:nuclear transport factor 2 family protein [Nocardia sp. CDC160]|uniref:nuclear transport factor 2 family protein n=1 Tax=Nocardia sp. CDC160 TaxID=3112166 RepID=UPI002DBB46A4|nr:nuclear transport factor 2 family protein [Nocardia sp. CDC160]MEC3919212.1 nuclear transport factor 2 family protein [Nocardia sp. CDC160]